MYSVVYDLMFGYGPLVCIYGFASRLYEPHGSFPSYVSVFDAIPTLESTSMYINIVEYLYICVVWS